MPVADKVVVVPKTCPSCGQSMEIECQFTPGFGYISFHRIDCPHCGSVNHWQMPGPVVDVLKSGTAE